ncbi:hypothetical protein GC163_06620 [bacterium]|nr:hypothetical protein [bacterium]
MSIQKLESQLAEAEKQRLQNSLVRKRQRAVFASFTCFVIAIASLWQPYSVLPFIFFVIAAISAFFYFDANGHLHEVRRRSSSTLFANFSRLKQDEVAVDSNKPHQVF